MKIHECSELIEALRAAPAIVPLQINANAISWCKADAASRGISLIEIDVSDIESDNDFLVLINVSLHELRLSDLLGNLNNKRLSHIFLVSSLHRIDEFLGSRILTVAQAFAGTSVRFCVLLPEISEGAELGATRKVLNTSASVLCLKWIDRSQSVDVARNALLIERFKNLERSLQELDERSKALESRGQKLRSSVKDLDIVGFIESVRPSAALRDRIESRLEQAAEKSTAIETRLSGYK